MTDREAKLLHKERTRLLDKWSEASSQDKLKILVRLIDIDDDLSESGSTARAGTAQTERRFVRASSPKPRKKII